MTEAAEASPETEAAPAQRARRRLLADLRPLRESPHYRRLWIGQSLSGIGSQITAVAVPVQVYSLTHSSLAVGMIGLALAVPLLVLGLVGGALADAVDRRRLVLVTSVLLGAVSVGFAVQALLDLRQLWLLYALTAVQSSLVAINAPARQTFMPRLLRPELFPAASALGQLSFQISTIVGPLLAGVLIAAWGLEAAYTVDAATFVFAIYGVLRLPPMRAEGGGAKPGLRSIGEGLRFLRHQPVLAAILLVDINATVLAMPHALFPALAETQFGGGSQTVGLLYAAPAIGGVLAALFSGPLSHIRRQGAAVLLAVAVWGATIAGVGLTHTLWLAVALLAVAGAADMVSVVFRMTMMQLSTPDALLGRINGVNFVVGAGVPHLGNVRAGVVAAGIGPALSAVTGGLACVAGVVLLAFLVPRFARYDAHPRR
ncbi:MFS transporter [Micromonospora pattaloongensis]|uniref:MFS transporter n=1 Tax=Micromonospora pattaloongensis TaxID=405436 RepID=UPI001C31D30D|nr:MFS transporter [Micromonospora pattaloongensis]